eukprot:c13781_g1_i1.p1 GENE.c13781_g1_i1~~c13781_g1_i1.p1  ORF type:complete len:107 (+),score=29.10 c13781_g1_i1:24-323(+)
MTLSKNDQKLIFFFSSILFCGVNGVWINGDTAPVEGRAPWNTIGVYTVWLIGIYIAMSIFLVFATQLFAFLEKYEVKRRAKKREQGQQDKSQELTNISK